MGMASEILSVNSRKPIFGYMAMIGSLFAIAILAFLVWAHHMFATGMPVTGQLFFMYATMLIAVPTGVKIFNWLATMWRGSMTFETPMLFAVGFIFVFTIGGFTGLTRVVDGTPPVPANLTAEFSIVAGKPGTIVNTTTVTTGNWLVVTWALPE